MKALLVVACAALLAAYPAAQSLTSAEISAAVADGLAGKTLQHRCKATGENGFEIVVEGPVGRIMRAAGEAKRA